MAKDAVSRNFTKITDKTKESVSALEKKKLEE